MARIVADGLNSYAMPETTTPFVPSLLLTLAFVLTLVIGLLLKYWLSARQIRYVAQHRSLVPTVFRQAISLQSHQKAADYTIAKTRLGLIDLALGAGALISWTMLGGLSWLNQTLLDLLGGGMVQQLTLLTIFVTVGAVIDLPLTLYRTFVLEERFGFNKMTPKLWLVDFFKSSLIAALVGLPLATLILWMMNATGSFWWVWAWAVWMGLNLLALLVYPTYIAPLFNKFSPLDDLEVKERVTALMNRCGFSAEGLFVMDGSKRSAHANAYFTGFGTSKRVVFYDTLLTKLNAMEVEAVLAHELGHFKHRHVIKRIATLFTLSLLGFALLGWLSTQAWFYTGLGVMPSFGAANDALALLLFMLAAPIFSFFVSPLLARFSRKHEFEADAYAVAQTNHSDLATALLKLFQDNASTLTPDPVYVKFFYSHPPAAERLARMSTKPLLSS